jgi:hypothetical protein
VVSAKSLEHSWPLRCSGCTRGRQLEVLAHVDLCRDDRLVSCLGLLCGVCAAVLELQVADEGLGAHLVYHGA